MFWMLYQQRPAPKPAAETWVQEEMIFPPAKPKPSSVDFYVNSDPHQIGYYRSRDPGCIEFYLSRGDR
jgi:hypothetical protein